ncbi:MAG: sigma-54-dependent Fis family transcriptional regulator [Planctomycetes bacterium]|nr:sigma-54-dependent Fis family transcriptional regulator [Planctomycetota bacterium]
MASGFSPSGSSFPTPDGLRSSPPLDLLTPPRAARPCVRSEALAVLVVDDDPHVRQFSVDAVRLEGHEVWEAQDGLAACEVLDRVPMDILLTDLHMPRMDGLTLVRRVREQSPATDIIVFTAFGSIDSAVACMKLGIRDYLTKPYELHQLQAVLEGIRTSRRQRALNAAHAPAETARCLGSGGPELVGRSRGLRQVLELIDQVKDRTCNVFIQGESGTGKELVARAIHNAGALRKGPFVAVNCAGLAPSVLEAQLFGHERGAFTGATASSPGLFRAADGGTLFLDEVTEIDCALQPKLLRAVQEREVLPVGGTQALPVSVRIVAATNRDLVEAVASGAFREDLFYRLCVVPILIPPLRERPEDIPDLIAHFMRRFGPADGQPERVLSPAAREFLTAYPWPGNIRELQNVVERIFVTSRASRIDVEHLPATIRCRRAVAPEVTALPPVASYADAERKLIEQALLEAGGNKSRAARMLGIERQRLTRKLRKFGLN